MNHDSIEYQRRRAAAKDAIKNSFGSLDDEYGSTLFVSHHLEHVDGSYWLKYLGSARPEPDQILGLLESRFDLDGGLEVFDFSLPEDVTSYVICVTFDSNGNVEDILMES